MTDIQDISCQLMKPPKELASWNFPLAQILEEYFNLLPEPCNIRYGEAALVIQNSVNAYVRKVEDLYDETKCFIKKMQMNSKEDEVFSQKNRNSAQSHKKASMSFGLFESENIDDALEYNINLKNNKIKILKFLHACFSKLENPNTRLHLEVFDRKNKSFGKMYDFRLNQQITRNYILIEELTPEDLQILETVTNSAILKSNFVNSQVNFDQTKKNLFNESGNDCDRLSESSVSEVEDNFVQIYDISEDRDDQSQMQSINCNDLEQKISENSCNSFQSQDLSEPSCNVNNQNMYNQKKSQNNLIDSYVCSSIPTVSNEETQIHSKNTETKIPITSNIPVEKDLKRKINDVSNTLINSTLRRSKRLKQEVDSSINGNVLEVIPFANGIPEKDMKCRKKFQFPCHKSLLKNSTKKPRKSNLKNKKIKESIEQEEINSSVKSLEIPNEKINMYSPTRPVNTDEDHKDFEQCFGQTPEKECFNINYEPIHTLTMELTGFNSDDDKKSNDLEGITLSSKYADSVSSPKNITPCLTPYTFDYCSSDRVDKKKTKVSGKGSQNYKEFIKLKIKKLHEELDIQTDEDQKIAEWHKEIKPRLQEAEHKPPFNIHEYESRIIKRMENYNRKILFDELIEEEPPSEVARYFSAALQLASTHNLDIQTSKDLNKSIELVLLE